MVYTKIVERNSIEILLMKYLLIEPIVIYTFKHNQKVVVHVVVLVFLHTVFFSINDSHFIARFVLFKVSELLLPQPLLNNFQKQCSNILNDFNSCITKRSLSSWDKLFKKK